MTTETLDYRTTAVPSDHSFSFSAAATNLIGALKIWHLRQKGRVELSRLDDRLLTDVGLTPFDAQSEMDKPFWVK